MKKPRVAVLVDLPREAASGGHVKYWERVAQAAAEAKVPLDLTVYFSGASADEILSPDVRLRFLPPVFSTARLKFLPYVPAHTDLAFFHPRLARELPDYDVIHTTDGCFAFARTAERMARRKNIPLVTSFHTDTPAYAELFTREVLESLLGKRFGRKIDSFFKLSSRERANKERRLHEHVRNCAAALAVRDEDILLAQSLIGQEKISLMRMGVDKAIFAPHAQARDRVEKEYGIGTGKFLVLFVGRVDAGKNMPLLLEACAAAIARGVKLHLFVAGIGPMSAAVKDRLGEHATLAGQLSAAKLAQLYAAVDCLAIASDIEIGGMIAPEALACGCPVLVSRHSGVAAACGHSPALQEVESTAAAWTQALIAFSQNDGRQKAMRAAALTFRRMHLAGWDDLAREDFLPVWQKVMQGKR